MLAGSSGRASIICDIFYACYLDATMGLEIVRRLQCEGWVNIGGGRHDNFEHPQRVKLLLLDVISMEQHHVDIGVRREFAAAVTSERQNRNAF